MRIKLSMGAVLIAVVSLFSSCNPSGGPATTGTPPTGPNANTANTPKPGLTSASGPLPDKAFKASISVANPPTIMEAGEQMTIDVKVKNTGEVTWPALGAGGYKFQVKLGNHWLDSKEKPVIKDDGRGVLAQDVKPGEEVEIPFTFTAPKTAGDYILELDMVQEDVSWFALKGSQPYRTKIKVE